LPIADFVCRFRPERVRGKPETHVKSDLRSKSYAYSGLSSLALRLLASYRPVEAVQTPRHPNPSRTHRKVIQSILLQSVRVQQIPLSSFVTSKRPRSRGANCHRLFCQVGHRVLMKCQQAARA
jgi:hypothetical protein